MALDLPRPTVPGLDPYGVLDIDSMNQQPLRTVCQATSAAAGMWIHPYWQGTTRSGKASDFPAPSQLLVTGTELIQVQIPFRLLLEIDQGHAMFSYTVQPDSAFEPGHEESDRTNVLVGIRHFPGAGLNVPSIREAHQLQFSTTDIQGSGAMAAIPAWQAMQAGDIVRMTWQGVRESGELIPELVQENDVKEPEVDLPLGFEIPRATIARTPGGSGLLSYEIEYAQGGRTVSPVQRFTILPAPIGRLPVLQILEHSSGGPIDPGLASDGLTFSINAYAALQEGDSLIISVEDTATHQVEFITGVRLDRSSVDSGLLQAKVLGDWLEDYLDRDIALRYQVARPGMGLGGEPLVLSVRATMNLPMPVVDKASGSGESEGEFRAEDAGDGISIRVPSKAVYPAGALVQMHWEGSPGAGSQVVTTSNGATRPTFVVSTSVLMPNFDKVVKLFYRVTANGDAPRDSEAFYLKVKPLPTHRYPTLQCSEATNGELRVDGLGSLGANMTIAPWELIALDQLLTISATGTLKTGIVETLEFVKDRRVTSTTTAVSRYLARDWLRTLAPNSMLELTVTVTADEGQAQFPRVYIKIIAAAMPTVMPI